MMQENQSPAKKSSVNPMAAAVAGAVIGAGAVILNQKKNRDQIKETFLKVKDTANKHLDKMMQKAAEEKKVLKKAVDEVKGLKKSG